TYSQEYACHSPQEKRFFNGRVSRFFNDGAVRIVVSHEDITARTQSEVTLRENRELLNDAQRQAHLGSWTRCAETGFVQWSEEMYRIFGEDPNLPAFGHEEHPGLYTPTDLARLEQVVHDALTSGKPYQIEIEILRRDGTRRTCITKGEADLDESGKVRRLRGTMQDITELKALAQELQKSHDLLNSLSRQIPGVVYQYRLFADGKSCLPYASEGIREI